MDTKEWLEILQKERQLLIEKTKWGAYLAVAIIIPTLVIIYDLVSHREESIFPILGNLAMQIIALVLLIIIVAGPSIFIFINYFKYQELEEIIHKIFSGEIKNDEDFHKNYQKKYIIKLEDKDKSKTNQNNQGNVS